ncbi:hypothetical protein [Dankookia sp. P2]|uniref:hypothetical protein n=1 Tax=Dankookia sp. P2 TaxID=3423955 RepID=UPI003D679D20
MDGDVAAFARGLREPAARGPGGTGWRARLKRRTLLRSAGGAGALGLGLGGYAFGYEPGCGCASSSTTSPPLAGRPTCR